MVFSIPIPTIPSSLPQTKWYNFNLSIVLCRGLTQYFFCCVNCQSTQLSSVKFNHKNGNPSLFPVRKVKCQSDFNLLILEIDSNTCDLFPFSDTKFCTNMFISAIICFIPYFRAIKSFKPWPMSMCEYYFVCLFYQKYNESYNFNLTV